MFAMNDTVKNDPWRVVPRLQDEINRLFGNLGESDSSAATAAWIPAVDIHEYADRFELYVDVPGVEPNKVELTLEDGVLTLSGKRAEQDVAKSGDALQYRRSERHLGRFYRRFVLPDTVDSENVNATGKDGVLKIAIPKQAKAKPRRIEISG
jgi:HSP20 family protein